MSRIDSVDGFKLLAITAVIAIHTQPFDGSSFGVLKASILLVFGITMGIPVHADPLLRSYLTPDSDLIHKTITED